MNFKKIFNPFQHAASNQTVTTTPDEWPEPEELRDVLLEVHPLATHNIPEPYRDWVLDVAERMQCPPDFIAVAAIVAAGSIIGTGCGIKPKEHDDWLVIPNLWGGLIGRPGMLKTPAVAEVMQLINQLETSAKEAYDTAMKNYLADLEIHKATKDAIKNALLTTRKQSIKSKSANTLLDTLALKEALLASDEPQKPVWKRYKTNDPTVEKLGDLLRENLRGVLLHRDELMGLFANWEKEGRESDRAFFLEAWNGDGSMTIDRITRGTIHVNNLCVSIFGNTQPAKISKYLYNAIRGNDNDGLLQRFQLLIYPDEPAEWQLVDRKPNHQAKDRAIKIINQLANMNFVAHGAIQEKGERFPYFKFDSDAQLTFNAWLKMLETRRAESDDHPILIEHLAKYRSLLPSLALIFHLIDLAGGKNVKNISNDTLLMGIGWCGYLEKHARRIYGMVNNNIYQAARKLSNKIIQDDLPSPFSVRDIYRKEWALLQEKTTVQKACDELVEAGWIRQEMYMQEVGRPKSPVYSINPKLKILSETGKDII